jgi:hypothetical protein
MVMVCTVSYSGVKFYLKGTPLRIFDKMGLEIIFFEMIVPFDVKAKYDVIEI